MLLFDEESHGALHFCAKLNIPASYRTEANYPGSVPTMVPTRHRTLTYIQYCDANFLIIISIAERTVARRERSRWDPNERTDVT